MSDVTFIFFTLKQIQIENRVRKGCGCPKSPEDGNPVEICCLGELCNAGEQQAIDLYGKLQLC